MQITITVVFVLIMAGLVCLLLAKWLGRSRPEATRIEFIIEPEYDRGAPRPVGFCLHCKEYCMAVRQTTLTTLGERIVQARPVDNGGHERPVDGQFAWASTDPTVVRVTPSADGRSATISSTGVVGTARITAEVDARMGEGTRMVMGAIDVTVTQDEREEAAEVDFDIGDQTDRPLE